MTLRHVTIAGASLAGLSAASGFRKAGFDGDITLVDPSPVLPPDRPPLSKQVLAGTMAAEAATQPMASNLDELNLELRLGVAATSLSVADLQVGLSDGSTLATDGVVIASGAAPRRLDTKLSGVHVVRTLEDSVAVKAELDSGAERIVVIGAGFIGAEVASTCRELGRQVTMIEAQDRPMQRVLPGAIGDFVTRMHRDHGVDVRLGVGIDGLLGDGRVSGVRLADGTEVPADLVVAGIGVVPNVDWLHGSGLDLTNGVLCDATMLAAPGVVAAGDIARWPNGLYDETMRVEQWENAIEQGGHAARTLLAERSGATPEPYRPVPWFWTDQFGLKIQLAGRVAPDDEVFVADGTLDAERFVALFRRGDRCIGALGVGRPRHAVQLRMKMAEPLPWDQALAHFAS